MLMMAEIGLKPFGSDRGCKNLHCFHDTLKHFASSYIVIKTFHESVEAQPLLIIVLKTVYMIPYKRNNSNDDNMFLLDKVRLLFA